MIFTHSIATVESEGKARIWYDDGDLAVEVHENLGLGISANELAFEIVNFLNRFSKIDRKF